MDGDCYCGAWVVAVLCDVSLLATAGSRELDDLEDTQNEAHDPRLETRSRMCSVAFTIGRTILCNAYDMSSSRESKRCLCSSHHNLAVVKL
jgi:hypothetical protein